MRFSHLGLLSFCVVLSACGSQSGSDRASQQENAPQQKAPPAAPAPAAKSAETDEAECDTKVRIASGMDGIVGGEEVYVDHWLAKKVISLVANGSVCTATLIDRDILLTAAHCVFEAKQDGVVVTFNQPTGCDTKGGQTTKRVKIKSTRIVIHSGYNDDEDFNDLALVQLEKPAPKSFMTVNLSKQDPYALAQKKVLVAGFGRTAGLEEGAKMPLFLHSTELALLLGENLTLKKHQYALAQGKDFDQLSPAARKILNEFFSEKPGSPFILLDQSEGSGICNGDSGGPAFEKVQGLDVQTGVASSIFDVDDETTCQFLSRYSSVSFHRKWIEGAYKHLKKKSARKDLYL